PVNHDVPSATVDGGDHLVCTDRVRELLRKVEIRLAVLEEGGTRDDLPGPSRENFAGASGRANAAANAAREPRSNVPAERQVMPGTHGCVEIDHLPLRKAFEPLHPLLDVLVSDGELLALHQLNDGAVFEVDRGNQHEGLVRLKPDRTNITDVGSGFSRI